MFYRMTRLHWEEDDYRAVLALAESLGERFDAIDGLVSAELVDTGAGEGMIISVYRAESDYLAASAEVASILDDLGQLLTSKPHGHQGTVALRLAGPQIGSDPE